MSNLRTGSITGSTTICLGEVAWSSTPHQFELMSSSTSPSALYGSGPRYGPNTGRGGPALDKSFGGLHGPKGKRGDMDRECKPSYPSLTYAVAEQS
jgi:hypothetical protein